MDRGAWQAAVQGVTRVGHDLVTKPPPPLGDKREEEEGDDIRDALISLSCVTR